MIAPAGKFRVKSERIIHDDGTPDAWNTNAIQHPLNELPPDALQFLMASRYCEVDRFMELAWKMFGTAPAGWPRVKAVCDWVFEHVMFGYQYARHTKGAWDTFNERAGVCRDFMHLAITFLRCLNIPARYATGYLGDIGVPPAPEPMDFAAFFEVYLSNRWWPVDARHNVPRQGRILMARGRDAVDVALATSFGPHKLTKFIVVTDEVK
jgi:transglutaminase-like putative cysteine protease